MRLHGAVALAGTLLQPFYVQQTHVAATVCDQTGLLQRIGHQRHVAIRAVGRKILEAEQNTSQIDLHNDLE